MSRANEHKRVVFAAAQTGGHLLPAVETARVMQSMGFDVVLVTSGQAIEKEILKNAGIPVRTLQVERIKAMGIRGLARGLASIPGALLHSATLLREIRPDVVVGFGGFTSGPLVMAAAMMFIPTAVFEANSIPGMTNKILARTARKVFVTFPGAGARLGRKDFEITGNPVRADILAVNKPAWTAAGKNLLVVGGSQGSRFLNQNVPRIAARLVETIPSLTVRHQCGLGNSAAVADEYRRAGVQATVSDYIQNMADEYAWADFMVCRAGAGTVGEVTAVGIPSLFVPFALAADDHQAHNAMDLASSGAALMTREEDFNVDAAAAAIGEILSSPARLNEMSQAARAAGRRDAAQRIAQGIAGLVKA